MSSGGYIAYIDEAGETGLAKVATAEERGSSEWLVLAATVVAEHREREAVGWAREIAEQCSNRRSRAFHYRKANDQQKLAACIKAGTFPVRHFVVCCHKKNMENYRNPAAARNNEQLAGYLPQKTGWFYYWATRLLLERVTHWVNQRSLYEHGEPRPLRLEFSKRGGVRYDEMSGYLLKLRGQDKAGTTYLKKGRITWGVLEPRDIRVFAHDTRAGLILPDIAASAFFQALEKHTRHGRVDPRPAMELVHRIPHKPGSGIHSAYDYGVKIMPHENQIIMDNDQKQIFRYYGYTFPDGREPRADVP